MNFIKAQMLQFQISPLSLLSMECLLSEVKHIWQNKLRLPIPEPALFNLLEAQ